MMTLYSFGPSPFGRKIKVLLAELGMKDQVQVEPANTLEDPDYLLSSNPLGKIPVLKTPDEGDIFNSSLIARYVLEKAGAGAAVRANWDDLKLEAMVDGALDAAILIVYKGRFEIPGENVFYDRQRDKINRTLDRLETMVDGFDLDRVPSLGELHVGVMGEYLDFRQPVADWRASRPKLSAYVDALGQRPSFQATQPTN